MSAPSTSANASSLTTHNPLQRRNLTLSTIKTLGRKSFSDLRKAFKSPPTPLAEIETHHPPHPPIAVPFVPHRNAPPVHCWDSEDLSGFMSRQNSHSHTQLVGMGMSTPRSGGTRSNSIYSSMSMSMSMSMSAGGNMGGSTGLGGMTSSMSMGEMRMPVDVHRLSGALTVVTLHDEMGVGKKLNRGARLCETPSGENSPV